MTTIVYCNGVIAADSQLTSEATDDKSGHSAVKRRCQKLFPFRVNNVPHIVATAGESAPGMWFVKWVQNGSYQDDIRDALKDSAEIDCLVLSPKGLFEFDQWCFGEQIDAPYHAIGSGAKAALGAFRAFELGYKFGSDRMLVSHVLEIAARIDPYTSGPFVTMSLEDVP